MLIENINFSTYESSWNNIPGTIARDKYKVATLISWTLIVEYPKEFCRTWDLKLRVPVLLFSYKQMKYTTLLHVFNKALTLMVDILNVWD